MVNYNEKQYSLNFVWNKEVQEIFYEDENGETESIKLYLNSFDYRADAKKKLEERKNGRFFNKLFRIKYTMKDAALIPTKDKRKYYYVYPKGKDPEQNDAGKNLAYKLNWGVQLPFVKKEFDVNAAAVFFYDYESARYRAEDGTRYVACSLSQDADERAAALSASRALWLDAVKQLFVRGDHE